MRQIRNGVFETNSSSVHSICIQKDKNITLCAEKLHYIDHACIDFIKGWEKERKEEMKNFDIHVAWEQMKETYPSFKWSTFHKEHGKHNAH